MPPKSDPAGDGSTSNNLPIRHSKRNLTFQPSSSIISKIQILLLGDSGAGKSSLVLRFADDEFQEDFQPTIGIDFKLRTLEINNQTVKVQVWDTAGQERFRTLTHSYFHKADGIVLVYDVTNDQSFKNISRWMEDIKSQSKEGVDVILVGNKVDLEEKRQVSSSRGQSLADQYGLVYFETSAKINQNVYESFQELTKRVLQRMSKEESKNKSAGTISVTDQSALKAMDQANKKKCCK